MYLLLCALGDLIVKVTPLEAGFDFTSLIIYISQLNNNPKM